MILITGGAYQGKLTFALSLLGASLEDGTAKALVADGKTDDYDAALHKRIIDHFHEYVRRRVAEGRAVQGWIEEITAYNPGVILITDELGCGIVPVKEEDRIWREEAGRSAAFIASKPVCHHVYRMVCGIPQKLKEDGKKQP